MITENQILRTLNPFIPMSQRYTVREGLSGGESSYFLDKIKELTSIVRNMPKTYETDGQGEEAVAYLHYFKNGFDWYITEKDMESEQLQAFGYVSSLHEVLACGYISIRDLVVNNIELDLHWKPTKIKDIVK